MRTFMLTACLTGLVGAALSQTNRQNVLDAAGSSGTIWTMRQTSPHAWVAAGNGGILLRHHDSSKNWLPVASPAGAGDYRSLSFPDSTTGYGSGTGNTLVKTTDGGASWTSLPSGLTGTTISIMAVHFQTATTGFVGGSALGGSGATGRFIRKTTDGGATWATVTPAGMTSTPYALGFFNGSAGVSAGVSGAIYRTTDGGATWAAVTSGTTSSLYAFAAADSNTAIVCGTGGTILRSTNKGASWTAIPSGVSATLQSVHFATPQHGMIAGLNGTLLRTTNGGQTWSPVYVPTLKNLYAVGMTDPAHALVTGSSGTALAVDTAQAFHRLFDEDFANPAGPLAYFGYTSTDLAGTGTRTWSFTNRNEANNGLQAAKWFSGPFAIYDASYYEDSLGQHQADSAFIETRALDFSASGQLTLRWNEAFYIHPDGRSRTRIQGYNGTTWIDLYESSGLEAGDGVFSAVFPDHKRSIDISALAGVSNAKLRFWYAADNTADGLKQYWAVGDVEVTTQATDLALTGLRLSPGFDAGCRYTGPQKLEVRVNNTGSLPVFPLEFGWKAGGQQGVGADYSALPAGASAWYTVADSIVVPQGGSLPLQVWLRKTPDALQTNDSAAFTAADNPVAPQHLGPDTILCNGGQLSLTAPAGLTGLQWSTGSTAQTISINQPGTYSFQAQWQTCVTGDTLVVQPGIAAPQLQQSGGTLSATPGALTYQWYVDGTAIGGATAPDLVLTGKGIYTVLVTGPGGCSAVSAPFAYNPTSVGAVAGEQAIRVYPNPAGSLLYLEGLLGVESVILTDPAGRRFKTLLLPAAVSRLSVDIHDLPAGVYFVHATSSAGPSHTVRILKAD